MSLPRKRLPAAELQTMVASGIKRFVKREEGMEIYSLGRHSFDRLGKDAGAVIHFGGNVLFDTEKMNKYLEAFYDDPE
ncbi:MAG: DUF6462 family protein [Lachnospiraceae bacterium]|nr:DUF6462 family protein [Lachnospiraceae bacterium]